MVHFVHWTARTGEPSTEWMVTILEIVPQNHYYVPRTYVRRETLSVAKKPYERLSVVIRGWYRAGMALKGVRRRTMEQWQDAMLRAIVRLAKRYGQWPSMPELAREMRIAERWARDILAAMRSDELVVLVGNAADAGWMPTAEGYRCGGVKVPTLQPGVAPPRWHRAQGVGAIRAWNKRQRLKARIAAHAVFDVDAPVEAQFEG